MSNIENDNAGLLAIIHTLSVQVAQLSVAVNEVRSLVGPFAVPMPDGQMLVQTVYGIKYLIDPSDLIMAPQLIVYRQWEADLSKYMFSALHKDSVFVDVGANFGYFTCLGGAKIGISGVGRVIAMEPNPKLVKLLRANTFINWSMCPIDIYPVAVGASEKFVRLNIPQNRAANASLTANADGSTDDQVDVAMKPVDSLVPAGVAIDMMKVDVEGHEHGVLEGAARVISESPNIRIVMEWSIPQMNDAGYSPADMMKLIKDLGLCANRLPALATDAITKFADDALCATPYDNILLTHS